MWLSDRPTIGDDITCIDHLVSTGDRWEGGQSPGAQVKVAVDGAGRGPVRGADDTVEVLHRGGDDVSHGGVGRLDTISRCDSVTCYIFSESCHNVIPLAGSARSLVTPSDRHASQLHWGPSPPSHSTARVSRVSRASTCLLCHDVTSLYSFYLSRAPVYH